MTQAAQTAETKHTPGPWFLDHDGDHISVLAPDGSDETPWYIATVICDAGPGDATPSNAGLIATAPELFESERKLANEVGALKAFEYEIRSVIGNTNWSILMERLAAADAAIAKAVVV